MVARWMEAWGMSEKSERHSKVHIASYKNSHGDVQYNMEHGR